MRHATPVSLLLLLASACTAEKPPAPAATAPAVPMAGKVEIKVTEGGFEPREVKAEQGKPLTLVFTRVTDATCITAIDIPDEQVKGFLLPLGRPASLTITPRKAGVERFHCTAMGMGNGKIIVTE
jgi:plastocyanin domain-containing protein